MPDETLMPYMRTVAREHAEQLASQASALGAARLFLDLQPEDIRDDPEAIELEGALIMAQEYTRSASRHLREFAERKAQR